MRVHICLDVVSMYVRVWFVPDGCLAVGYSYYFSDDAVLSEIMRSMHWVLHYLLFLHTYLIFLKLFAELSISTSVPHFYFLCVAFLFSHKYFQPCGKVVDFGKFPLRQNHQRLLRQSKGSILVL